MIETLAFIEGTHRKGGYFNAGIVLFDDVVVEAAPIVGYMARDKWSRDHVREHCKTEGWKVSVIWQNERRDIDSKGRATRELKDG